jgi:hypothetical protein
MIIRSWFCLNKHCQNQWDGEGDHPPCPRCGGIRVQWVPRPVAIRSEATKKIDGTVRQMTSVYGDKNYRSPRRDESMAPRASPVASGKTQRFTPSGHTNWAVDLPLDVNGQPVAICAPTGVTAKLPVAGDKLGSKNQANKWAATATGAVPRYEYVHKGDK